MPSTTSSHPQRLRLWPGVLAAALLLLARFVLPVVWPEQTALAVLGGIAGSLAIVLWWTLFSRAPRLERWGALAVMIAGLAATWPLLDVSIATGAMGGLFPLLALPPLAVAFVVSAVAAQGLADGPRRVTMAAAILLACGVWTLAKTGGFSGSFDNDLMWRWALTPEERLLAAGAAALPPPPAARAETSPGATAAAAARPATADVDPSLAQPDAPTADTGTAPAASEPGPAHVAWPGFRGAGRDGVVRGVRIDTDWTTSPPVEVWRQPIGPGWSSFAVDGTLAFTQEQRGDEEIVAAYSLATGTPVWMHRDDTRFWESNGGAGPRATPTLSNGRVYAFGATGILNALEAESGRVVWTRNVASETNTAVPMWGFSSSPLVVDGAVVVAAEGTLAAYDLATGAPRWVGPVRGASYSSPHHAVIDGVPQLVLMTAAGVTSVAPGNGAVLWEYPWSQGQSVPVVQPTLTENADVLISAMGGSGTRRIALARGPGGWTAAERWTSNGLKPMFNDLVIHKGHAFGFDGSILASIDLTDGRRTWKGGRYGNGQLILLPEQDVLLVLSEEGELALVSATPDRFTELARVKALEGKTWNHPVLIGSVLLVRNGQEMAAFQLPLARR